MQLPATVLDNIAVQCELLSHVELCDPMDCRLPGSSVHGILQARILERLAILFSRGSSQPGKGIEPGSPTLQADSSPFEPPVKPIQLLITPQSNSSCNSPTNPKQSNASYKPPLVSIRIL